MTQGLPVPAGPSDAKPLTKRGASALMPAAKPAAITMGGFAVVLVLVQVANYLTTGHDYLAYHLGIEPRSLHGLIGIITAPLLHWNWQHLIGNIVPFVILGFLVMVSSVRQWVAVTVLVWLVSGLGVWLTAGSNSVTVGASAVVFGWLAYLVVRGVFQRSFGQIVVGLICLAVYGGIFWTGIVSQVFGDGGHGISWQGHLFGAIGGVLAAFLVAKADGPRRAKKVDRAPAGLTPLPPT